jgi:hypothetical protein
MSANEGQNEDFEGVVTDRALRFWATLVVATLIVGFTAYVLSFALLAPSGAHAMHKAASSDFTVAS